MSTCINCCALAYERDDNGYSCTLYILKGGPYRNLSLWKDQKPENRISLFFFIEICSC